MPEIFSKKVQTNREKAVAASELGQVLIAEGEDKETAGNIAAHELKHALAHKGGRGTMGLISNDVIGNAYYSPEDNLSDEETRAIAEAVGKRNMSAGDKKLARGRKLFGFFG